MYDAIVFEFVKIETRYQIIKRFHDPSSRLTGAFVGILI